MGWLEFIARIVEALAWPAAIVFAMWLWRSHLARLIRLVRSMRYKEFEVNFGEALGEAEEEAGESVWLSKTYSDTERPTKANELDKEFLDLAERYPDAAILRSWSILEGTLRNIAAKHNYPEPKIMMKLRMDNAADGKPDESLLAVISHLRRIRNAVVHGQMDDNTTLGSIISYRELASKAATALEDIYLR